MSQPTRDQQLGRTIAGHIQTSLANTAIPYYPLPQMAHHLQEPYLSNLHNWPAPAYMNCRDATWMATLKAYDPASRTMAASYMAQEKDQWRTKYAEVSFGIRFLGDGITKFGATLISGAWPAVFAGDHIQFFQWSNYSEETEAMASSSWHFVVSFGCCDKGTLLMSV